MSTGQWSRAPPVVAAAGVVDVDADADVDADVGADTDVTQ